MDELELLDQQLGIESEEDEKVVENNNEVISEEEVAKEYNKDDHFKTLLEEKQKRKELERKLKSYEDNQIKQQYFEKWVNKGFEAEYAEEQANIEYRIHLQDQKLKEIEMDSEISDLAKEDEYFADALEYKSEIKKKMKEKSLSAEEAYLILRKKIRDIELSTDREQKELLQRRNSEIKSQPPTSTSISPKNPYPLDDVDKKALKRLQKIQPDSNWDEKKYFNLMKKK